MEPEIAAASADRSAGIHADFQALFLDHYDYVWTSLRRLGVPDRDREDVTNELFVRVHQRLDTFDQTRPLRPWLFAFAVRFASDYRRLARHRVERLDTEDAPPEARAPGLAADEVLMQDERRRLVLAALERLDMDKRAVVVLHDLDETPIPEVARALGIPEGTAYTRLRTGRAELTLALRRLSEKSTS